MPGWGFRLILERQGYGWGESSSGIPLDQLTKILWAMPRPRTSRLPRTSRIKGSPGELLMISTSTPGSSPIAAKREATCLPPLTATKRTLLPRVAMMSGICGIFTPFEHVKVLVDELHRILGMACQYLFGKTNFFIASKFGGSVKTKRKPLSQNGRTQGLRIPGWVACLSCAAVRAETGSADIGSSMVLMTGYRRSKRATLSICQVWGNISTGCTSAI